MDISTQYALATGEGDSRKAENLYGILHDVGTPNGSARNVASYEKRTYNDASCIPELCNDNHSKNRCND